MRFGKKAGTINSGPSGGTTDWPKGVKKGETRVRFVAEIPDWHEYWEHYDETVKFFPCTGDKTTCPGCTSDSERTRKASKKYLAPVLDPSSGKVYGLKMGQELANRLDLRNDRNNGTITNRDYTLIRSGDGLDTEYDVEQEEKVAIDLSSYQGVIDLEGMLAAQFAAAWPNFVDEDGSSKEDKPAPRKRAAAKKAAPAKGTLESMKESADKAKAERAEDGDQAQGSSDDPPSEAAVAPEQDEQQAAQESESDEDEGDTVEITEEDLRAMSRQELIKLAKQAELPVTLTMGRDQIIEQFLEQFAV